MPELFDHYHATLGALRAGAALEPSLRIFEKRLLEVLGYGLDLGRESLSGRPVQAQEYYHFRPAQGLIGAGAVRAGALAGQIPARPRGRGSSRARARSRMRAGCSRPRSTACLEGRQLTTRTVAARHACTGRPRLMAPHRPRGQHRSRGDAAPGAPRARTRTRCTRRWWPSRPAPTASRCTCARTAATSRTRTCARCAGCCRRA